MGVPLWSPRFTVPYLSESDSASLLVAGSGAASGETRFSQNDARAKWDGARDKSNAPSALGRRSAAAPSRWGIYRRRARVPGAADSVREGTLKGERRPGVVRIQRMRLGRVLLLAGVLVSVWLGATVVSRGQNGPQASARPRALYQMGFDLFKRGGYENAELYYKQAQKRQDELTLREREDLRLAIERNNVALQ